MILKGVLTKYGRKRYLAMNIKNVLLFQQQIITNRGLQVNSVSTLNHPMSNVPRMCSLSGGATKISVT